jgi:biopolymer transport protein ExbD
MSHHRKKKPEGSQGVQLGLIITPMLDMSFQILAFFIMTYNPSALEGHIPGSLVPPENYAKKSKDANPMPDVETPSISEDELDPALQEAITVKAKVILKGQEIGSRTEGMLGQIFVKTVLDTEATLVADTDVTIDVAVKKLEEKLVSMAPKGGGKDAKSEKSKMHLKIAAEGELRQQYVLMLYDAAKKAGYLNISFVPPPVLNTKFK